MPPAAVEDVTTPVVQLPTAAAAASTAATVMGLGSVLGAGVADPDDGGRAMEVRWSAVGRKGAGGLAMARRERKGGERDREKESDWCFALSIRATRARCRRPPQAPSSTPSCRPLPQAAAVRRRSARRPPPRRRPPAERI